jgi:hypothetical protein
MVPKELAFKKQFVFTAAASKYHTVIVTTDGSVYQCGTNHGQLGFQCDKQIYLRKVTSIPQYEILQVQATNYSTVLLLKNYTAIALTGGSCKKVSFLSIINSSVSKNSFSYRPPYPLLVRASEIEVFFIMSNGDVAVLNQDGQITKAWCPQKHIYFAKDCAPGQNGSPIVLTKDGQVFQCIRSNNNQFKYTKVQNLEHITSVHGSLSGSFAAVRDDYCDSFNPDFLNLDHYFRSLNYKERIDQDFSFITSDNGHFFVHQVILCQKSQWFQNFLLTGDVSLLSEGICYIENDGFPTLKISKVSDRGMELFLRYLYRDWTKVRVVPKEESSITQEFRFLCKYFEIENVTLPIDEAKLTALSNYQVLLADGVLDCHSVFLRRSPFFEVLLGQKSGWDIHGQRKVIYLSHHSQAAFQVVWKWLLTDSFVYSFEGIQLPIIAWIEFLKSVSALSDELMLFGLVDYCCLVLNRFLTVRSIVEYLNYAWDINAKNMFDVCLLFGCFYLM